jgi:3-oxoacyl-[acyl-carrier protein] reductase
MPESWIQPPLSNVPCQAITSHLGTAPRIVNVSSVIARMGGSYATAYCASKAALEGITKVWAKELEVR